MSYLNRTPEGWCAAFDPATNRCRIYESRPLCCRLYPLDLMELDGFVWWVIHSECPIARRFQAERRSDVLAALTLRIETQLTDRHVAEFLTQDKTSDHIEAFSFEENKVIKIRKYGDKSPVI